jgi:hypothetical protein
MRVAPSPANEKNILPRFRAPSAPTFSRDQSRRFFETHKSSFCILYRVDSLGGQRPPKHFLREVAIARQELKHQIPDAVEFIKRCRLNTEFFRAARLLRAVIPSVGQLDLQSVTVISRSLFEMSKPVVCCMDSGRIFPKISGGYFEWTFIMPIFQSNQSSTVGRADL